MQMKMKKKNVNGLLLLKINYDFLRFFNILVNTSKLEKINK